jgi:hypothetical protein
MAKAKKKLSNKYDNKLAITGSFEDIIKISAEPYAPKPKPIKPPRRNRSNGCI